MPNEHNGKIPKSFWLLKSEADAIIEYRKQHPRDGYKRLTYMMIDEDIAAVSPSSVYRVLKEKNLIELSNNKPSKKGTGFHQPINPHEHWHIDISYINIASTFYYLCSILDGYSRFIVHWELRESMKEAEIEVIITRAEEKFPGVKPRIISDNGPQFIANDFKAFIRAMEMSHVRTSPYYPQSNGKLERWHGSIKSECIRVTQLDSKEHADRVIDSYVDSYNNDRLHSAIGYVAPFDKLMGNENKIFTVRAKKLNQACERRRLESHTVTPENVNPAQIPRCHNQPTNPQRTI